jgi:hypothetical protein
MGMMGRILQYFLVGFIFSLFYFSFGFTFLPESINTKVILALLGLLLSSYHAIQNKIVRINRSLIKATGIALLFSLICFIAVDYNYTADLSYATYLVSFGVWIFSAYTVCTIVRMVHGDINVTLITCYLAGVCFFQCVLALLIDAFPVFQLLVDAYVNQGQTFLLVVHRLYGIGASLDNAGVRFSIVLIMMAAVISKDYDLLSSPLKLSLLIGAFFTIIIVGNIISRTTLVGALLAVLYLLWNTGTLRLVITTDFFRFHVVFGTMMFVAIVLTVYFFKTDQIFQEKIRFAFEGFFNYAETGEWRTNSTDKLNKYMWVWPEDTKTWLIGTGLFDNWIYGTDIGYCRFILYCGLPGFSIFAFFFVFHASVFAHKYRQYRDMFFLFVMLSFIVWIKVSTDIFLIYALFYCMDMFHNNRPLTHQDEDRLLYSQHV